MTLVQKDHSVGFQPRKAMSKVMDVRTLIRTKTVLWINETTVLEPQTQAKRTLMVIQSAIVVIWMRTATAFRTSKICVPETSLFGTLSNSMTGIVMVAKTASTILMMTTMRSWTWSAVHNATCVRKAIETGMR